MVWELFYLWLILANPYLCFPNPSLVRRFGFFQPILHQTILRRETTRLKRSLTNPPLFLVWFHAFDRRFTLKLDNATSPIFSPSAKIKILKDEKEEILSVDLLTRHLVEGKLYSESNSEVVGCLYDGVFTGSIQTDSETYFVEFTESYFSDEMPFKTFIYRGSDVPNQYIIPERQPVLPITSKVKNASYENIRLDQFEKHRVKRIPAQRETCHMKIITDHTFYQRFSNQMHLTTFLEVLGIFNQVNALFRNSRFFSQDPSHVIGLMIAEIQIIVKQDEVNYFMSDLHLSSTEFLDYLSLYDFNDFCLALCLVKRSFTDGHFGASFLGKPSYSHEAGICSTWKSVDMKSRNIAVVSLVADNHRLPNAVIVVSVSAHLGRLFGSDYDPPDNPECSPESSDPYVMYNCNRRKCFRRVKFQFSNCSLRQIDALLQIKSTCLVPPYDICGNGVKDGEEECDCGPSETCDMLDKCCNPPGAWSIVGDAKPCGLKEGSQCSPKSSYCCTDDCQFPSIQEPPDCTMGNECLMEAWCDPITHTCPIRRLKQNGVACGGGTGKCRNGDCNVDVCQNNGTTFCRCAEPDFSCAVCCKDKHGICVPASKLSLFKADGIPYRMRQGKPCFEDIGECSPQGFCNAMDGWTILEAKTQETTDNKYEIALYLIFVLGMILFLAIVIIIGGYLAYLYYRNNYREKKKHRKKKTKASDKKENVEEDSSDNTTK